MKRTPILFLVIFICAAILAACGASTPTAAEVQPAAAVPATAEPAATASPAPSATEQLIPTPTFTATPRPPLPCNIAFDSDRDNNHEIYVMGPDGSNPLNLTNNPGDDFDPVWSPDGTHIAFVSNRAAEGDEGVGGQYIYVMLADGSDVVQLSHQEDSKSPDWSPMGDYIAFSAQGDIYLIDVLDGSEANLTNSPEPDEWPKISPDGQHIAWLSGDEGSRQVFVMDADGGNPRQVTRGGQAHDAEWTVDGRLFTHWENPDGTCFNCVVTVDGKEVIDAGGKGAIQEYLPFWTADGQRVEMISGAVITSDEEILLVSDIFPDVFLNLTDNPGNDRNPDAPANCGPLGGQTAADGPAPAETQPSQSAGFVIGYKDGGSLTEQMQQDLEQACVELDVQCLPGEDIASLAAQKVDAIISFSNKWHVMGSYLQLHEAVEQGIPVFVLNAETGEPGAYNLSAENEIITTTLKWMFKQMGDTGEFVYYNFGNSDYDQQLIDAVLKEYPGIQAIKKEADYNGNSFTEQDITNLIAKNPNPGAIWSNENLNDLFWGVRNAQSDHPPLIPCPANLEILSAWKESLESGVPLRCLAYIRPGGTAYEAVYAAYYYLTGHRFKADALVGEGGNTLRYSIPEITNENLLEWLGKSDSFSVNQWGGLELPHMSPDQILEMWFEE